MIFLIQLIFAKEPRHIAKQHAIKNCMLHLIILGRYLASSWIHNNNKITSWWCAPLEPTGRQKNLFDQPPTSVAIVFGTHITIDLNVLSSSILVNCFCNANTLTSRHITICLVHDHVPASLCFIRAYKDAELKNLENRDNVFLIHQYRWWT